MVLRSAEKAAGLAISLLVYSRGVAARSAGPPSRLVIAPLMARNTHAFNS